MRIVVVKGDEKRSYKLYIVIEKRMETNLQWHNKQKELE